MTSDVIATAPLGNGLYRIAGTDDRLVYVGEGAVRARLITHLAKLNGATSQGTVFAAHAPLAASIVIDKGWKRHQRLELETDLIAAVVLAMGAVPAAQFIG